MTAWHPIFITTEPTPGVWEMKTDLDYAPLGKIELRRTDGGPRYKVTLHGELIGWAMSLKIATEKLWEAYIASKNPNRRH